MKTLLYSFMLFIAAQSFGQEAPTKWITIDQDFYQIEYPENWSIDTSGRMNTGFILYSPLSNEEDEFTDNVNLLLQDLSGLDLDLDKFMKLSIDQLDSFIDESELLLNERKNKDGLSYQKIVYNGKLDKFNFKFLQYIWVIKDKSYLLTFTCEQAEFEKHKDVAEKILNSFKLKNLESN